MWRAARSLVRASQALWRPLIESQTYVTLAKGNRRCTPAFTKHHGAVSVSTKSKTDSIKAVSSDDTFLTVIWKSGDDDSRFPFIYLRDNCQCTECFHQDSLMRVVEIASAGIPTDIVPFAVEVESDSVKLTWPCGHISVFNSHWFYDHKPGEESENQFQIPVAHTWTAAEFPTQNVFQLDGMLNDHAVQYQILESFYKHGVVLVKGCGAESLPIEVHKNLGIIQDTAYGPRWLVKPVARPNNLAYSSNEFHLHTDLPYLRHTPHALILHCFRQAPTGGHTFLVDGFAVAAAMKADRPDLYEMMKTVPISFEQRGYDEGGDCHYHYQHAQPMLTMGKSGELEKVAFGVHTRGSLSTVDPDRTRQVYDALKYWVLLCKNKKFRYELLLEEGDMLIANNFRIAHGRGAVNDTRKEGRCLQGCYYNVDDMHSRMRYLHYKLKNSA